MSIPYDSVSGIVFDIQRFSIHDGPGIRTNVFLKGCPLRCVWCHNPESYESKPDILFDPKKCILCGACAQICPLSCHQITKTGHTLKRSECRHCLDCARICPSEALESCGKYMTADEVMTEVLADKAFYRADGGITLSGGEPMAQPDFSLALLKKAKESGLSTCIETSGFCSRDSLIAIVPYTDFFLYDCKETDPIRHKAFTGVDPQRILEHLFLLDWLGARLILRCPLIPAYNAREEHLLGIVNLANSLKNILEVNVEPYHSLGTVKTMKLGRTSSTKIETPNDELIEQWLCFLRDRIHCPVKRA